MGERAGIDVRSHSLPVPVLAPAGAVCNGGLDSSTGSMRHPHRLLLLSLLLVLASSVVSPPASGLPDTSLVSCSTTKGTIKLEVHPAWAPLGAERFLELVSSNFFADVAL